MAPPGGEMLGYANEPQAFTNAPAWCKQTVAAIA